MIPAHTPPGTEVVCISAGALSKDWPQLVAGAIYTVESIGCDFETGKGAVALREIDAMVVVYGVPGRACFGLARFRLPYTAPFEALLADLSLVGRLATSDAEIAAPRVADLSSPRSAEARPPPSAA